MDLFGAKARERQKVLAESLKVAVVAPSPPGQPHDFQHPGSDFYPHTGYTVGTHRVWHFKFITVYPTVITYLVPDGPVPSGGFPVLVISPGKFLDNPAVYNQFLRHVCRKGYIVMFVDADTGPVDCEHSRMAGEFLEGVADALKRKLGDKTGSAPRLAWWGHSMGAKVQALAASMVANKFYRQPAVIFACNFSNDKGKFCNDDALVSASRIPIPIRYNIIRGDQDEISNTDPYGLYDSLVQLAYRQLIKVVSYPDEGLLADHFAPLTDSGFPVGGVVNALDWWLYWKITVGALDYHFKDGPLNWAYGENRTDGGTDSSGNKLTHEIEAESTRA